jgi:hypothetical protein
MPAFRIGFGSDFTLANQLVGIGTTTARRKLEVDGVLKGDFNVSGVSTLTVYGGFVPEYQNISVASTTGFSTSGVGTFVQVTESETGYLSLVGEYNTVSEDIIVDEGRIFEVSVGSTVSPGTLESVSIQSHFSVPNGGSSNRPNQPTEGMVRFNDDLNTLEFYNGIEWRQFTVTGASGRGVFGSAFGIPAMDYVNISSLGNAVNFGVTTLAAQGKSGCSSSIRGLWGGGYAPGVLTNIIDYVTIQSEGNAIDFGDLTIGVSNRSSCSSSTRGIWAGGANPTNVIEYIQIATIGNALDFGDLTLDRQTPAALSSPTRGVFAGGTKNPLPRDIIDYITIASTGNAVNFGTLTATRSRCASFSSSTRGILGGGLQDTLPTIVNVIDYITIASVGNAQDFGDLTVSRSWAGGTSTQIRGIFAGGQTPSVVNTIDYITIASIGNAIDFGDLTVPKWSCDGVSDSHGGLGGF